MKFFGKSDPTPVLMGAALLALVGSDSASAEQIDAANEELEAAGLKGAQLVPGATLDDLTAKADRVDTAESAVKATADAVKAAGATSVADLIAQRDAARKDAEEFGSQPGELPTGSTKVKPDVEEGADEATKAIDELPHNKALAGHPLFG
jgi:hypothetical protein